MVARSVWRRLIADPRHGQIAVLATLLGVGLWRLGFDLTLTQVVVTLGAALATQALADHLTAGRVTSGARSALISGLSLCLLLRTEAVWLAAAGSMIAVGSKFVVRVRGKHVFNPTNVAIVVLLTLTDRAWVSGGQWGHHAAMAFFLACAGLLVVNKAARTDVTLAFMSGYAALLVGRSLWLGEPLAIPLHRLESGAFLLFSFFMISDPKTTPDTRLGRVIFALLVAWGAWYIQFRLFRTNGLLWALMLASPLVPLIDLVLRGARYQWPGYFPEAALGGSIGPALLRRRHVMSRLTMFVLTGLVLAGAARAEAFCGFYVAKADTKLFNKASQVVLVRDGDRTVITMANDFRGDPKEFAMVVPVPTAIQREQIHVGDKAVIEHLDAFTAPRLVEYFDPDPCSRRYKEELRSLAVPSAAPMRADARRDLAARSLGVTIEAQYTVGEYDILILSAVQSSGLETWLRTSGYRVPAGASTVLAGYIKQNMRFFVAKVNLTEQAKGGYSHLRPIQIAYESPKFMLPIRLGMVNADGAQELYVYTLTRKGRVETTNYRTVKLRTDADIPGYIKDPKEFGRMYRAIFDEHVKRENMSAVFQEYAWDMGWCDPCAADPLAPEELRRLGVYWVGGTPARAGGPPQLSPSPQNVFVTRLHVRYDQAHFPEDLVFQETGDRTNFQGRYVIRQPWTGPAQCPEAEAYRRELRQRQELEARTLASLTGWSLESIRRRIGLTGTPDDPKPAEWWRGLWGN
jgi:Na+-translocating ferredoxin:NAD+ oxidoreductase RnfD subunit